MADKLKKILYDVLIVGGGASSLSAAHRLVDLAIENETPLKLAVLEKGKEFGSHPFSGAATNPRSIKKLFPDYETNGFPIEATCSESYVTLLGREKAWNIPNIFAPPEMNKKGYLVVALSSVAKWMAAKLEEKIKEHPNIIADLYNGFPANEIVYEGERVAGVRVDDTGEPFRDNCYAKVTIFGDKGFLSQDIIKKFDLAESAQTWTVGVKEVWDVQKDYNGKVWHTLGFPLFDGTFGGGFIYGRKNNKLAVGMVCGLDSENPNIRPPQVLQEFKKHPWVQSMLKGGKITKYGAALIPEGGYYSLPKDFAVDGAVIIGDALGVMDVKGFSGVDKSMESGMCAADVVHEALLKNDYSRAGLGAFKEKLMNGWVGKELFESRYYRYAFSKNDLLIKDDIPNLAQWMDRSNAYVGGVMTFLGSPSILGRALNAKKMMDGKTDFGKVVLPDDRTHIRADYKPKKKPEIKDYDKGTIYSTADVVFYAFTQYHPENAHIEEFDSEVCKRCIKKFETHGNEVPCVGDCTAEVHEVKEKDGSRTHHMNLENCVQCRTCEIVCPGNNLRVNPGVHGSGPDFYGL